MPNLWAQIPLRGLSRVDIQASPIHHRVVQKFKSQGVTGWEDKTLFSKKNPT